MSLEEAIKANTAAVEALRAAVTQQNETVAKALGAKGGTAAKSTSTTAAKKTTTTKKAPAKPKALTAEDVRSLFGPYLAGAADKATKKRLIETTKPLLEHFGVDKITEVDAEQREEALKLGQMLVDAFEEGGIDAAEIVQFPFMGEDSDDEDDDEDGDEESVL